MKGKIIIAAALGIMTFTACKKETEADNALVPLKGCINKTYQSGTVTLCLDSIIDDSRCPANANCVWAGMAVARFTFTSGGQSHSFNLSTTTLTPYHSDTTVYGYNIAFLNLSPYPGDGNTANPQALVRITR